MNFILILAVALALAMDAFAVSVGVSLRPEGLSRKQSLRMAVCFGFFQFMMPLIGWQMTQSILQDYIEPVDHWVAFGLLLVIGARMISESFRFREYTEKSQTDPTRGLNLFVLSVATSIDAFAVGISFAALQTAILFPAGVIGVVAFLMTLLGTKIGPPLGRLAGKKAELFGGLLLILIGVKILFEHI